MHLSDPEEQLVVVVGAGPVGLMLAGELRLGGAEVIVLEKLAEPISTSRGLGFTARAAEVFAQRGLLARFTAPKISREGHFGGIPLDYGILEGGHFGVRNVEQTQTQAVLADWAREPGADIRRAVVAWPGRAASGNGGRAVPARAGLHRGGRGVLPRFRRRRRAVA